MHSSLNQNVADVILTKRTANDGDLIPFCSNFWVMIIYRHGFQIINQNAKLNGRMHDLHSDPEEA